MCIFLLNVEYPPFSKIPLQICDDQDSHRHWKTWKNETTFSSQGKVREF